MIILMVYHAVWYCFGFGVFEKVLNFWRYGQCCELGLKVKFVSATGTFHLPKTIIVILEMLLIGGLKN